ncbi:MAG: hypothetical protein RBS50_02875 [Phenylobacterium sp.]|jgi:hypothetical protein|uniref:hypothetical protein n=1 Tax=Phenylobacterium sp. TaxID=1871053 RepID=UPI002A340567|nr:hypothetical protein [Phenylobacterium sp.]MDD3836273.1 hypothetical protein [Phenylobacterium sp.]MDX9996883.1 hypothetical protein [Phenylobacterium sp.]
MKKPMFSYAAAVGALSLAACGTTMTERAATGGLAGAAIGAAVDGSVTGAVVGGAAGAALGAATTPRYDNVNRRQYYDQSAGRYYFYDPGTGRYYWENGQPRD